MAGRIAVIGGRLIWAELKHFSARQCCMADMAAEIAVKLSR